VGILSPHCGDSLLQSQNNEYFENEMYTLAKYLLSHMMWREGDKITMVIANQENIKLHCSLGLKTNVKLFVCLCHGGVRDVEMNAKSK
jgi:hypothetical protein